LSKHNRTRSLKRCSLCLRDNVAIQLVLRARRANGNWLTLYQMCWECGYEPLRELAMRPAGLLA
jgi:hypothetical protein